MRDAHDRTWRGFNLFLKEDQQVLLAITRGEFFIHGLSNKRLRELLGDKTKGQMSRILRRLRNHGLLKKIAHTYRYYLSAIGRRLITVAAKLCQYMILPGLKPHSPASR